VSLKDPDQVDFNAEQFRKFVTKVNEQSQNAR
jgi:hypothetical protein